MDSIATQTVSREMSPESYTFLQRWIHQETGIVLEDRKEYLLTLRLAPIVRRERLRDLDDLCRVLRENRPGIAKQVMEAMTTHETLFFRDGAPFEALQTVIVPQMLADRPLSQPITAWSAAASTGQEAYSLAMLLLDMGVPGNRVRITGTDLSERVLEQARAGLYNKFEVNRGLTPGHLSRHFRLRGSEWQLSDEVRSMVDFQQLDLRQGARVTGPFDLVFCRNVLIYFDNPTKRSILTRLHATMAHGAFLFLGAAETASSVPTFTRVKVGDAVAYTTAARG